MKPCDLNPCGPNTNCRNEGQIAVCQCHPGTFGNPNIPTGCVPVCVTNSQCDMREACISRHCQDPCIGACGLQALCDVINHTPMCRCPTGFIGDPAYRCIPCKTLRCFLVDISEFYSHKDTILVKKLGNVCVWWGAHVHAVN